MNADDIIEKELLKAVKNCRVEVQEEVLEEYEKLIGA